MALLGCGTILDPRGDSASGQANILCCRGNCALCFHVNVSQLFGEEDADQEVSPDTADPEASCEYNTCINYVPHIITTFFVALIIS